MGRVKGKMEVKDLHLDPSAAREIEAEASKRTRMVRIATSQSERGLKRICCLRRMRVSLI